MADASTRRAGELHQGVAEEIGVLLVRRRMTAQELARKLGWSQSTMSRRMVGDQPFDLDELERIAKAFGVDAVDLIPRQQRGGAPTHTLPRPGYSRTLDALGVPTTPIHERHGAPDERRVSPIPLQRV